ncbi:hypothetical protein DL765_009558 [Monosporascus sp. GIB2]|nr:hypothetical protein DL765_009558 [Monosporascus sp. GIB2]
MGHHTKKASRGDDDDHRDDKRRSQKKGGSSSGSISNLCPMKRLRKRGKGKEVAEEDPDLGWEHDYQVAQLQAQHEWAQHEWAQAQQQQQQQQQERRGSISDMYWEDGDPEQYAQSASSETESLIRVRDRAGEAARSNRRTQRLALGGHVYRDAQMDQEGRRVARDHAGVSWHLDVNNNRIGALWNGAWYHLDAYGNPDPDRPYVATREDLSAISEGTENGSR